MIRGRDIIFHAARVFLASDGVRPSSRRAVFSLPSRDHGTDRATRGSGWHIPVPDAAARFKRAMTPKPGIHKALNGYQLHSRFLPCMGRIPAFLLRTIKFDNLQSLPLQDISPLGSLDRISNPFYICAAGGNNFRRSSRTPINGFWSSPQLQSATIVSRNRFALKKQKRRDNPKGMSSSSDQAMIATQYLQIWCNLPSILQFRFSTRVVTGE